MMMKCSNNTYATVFSPLCQSNEAREWPPCKCEAAVFAANFAKAARAWYACGMRFLFSTGSLHNVTLELHPDALDAGQADGHIVDLLHTSVDACRRWAAGAPAQAVAA